MLNAIVFDIDGTLWQTGSSYIYAYHKLCDFYGIEQRATDNEIKDCLGIKIEQVLEKLFPSIEDKTVLTNQALDSSIEYLLTHSESCCFEGVTELLKALSEKYEIYLISNCPKKYADTFVHISGTGDYIKNIFTIEDGEKNENIEKIASALAGKMLFVGDSPEDYEALFDRYTQYFCYAKYGYKTCEQYDYAINKPLDLMEIVEKINIKERQANDTPYRMFSYKENQITLMKKDDSTAYFGFVKCVDKDFNLVVKELKANCDVKLIGPINFNTYYPYRFATDSFDWKLYPDCDGENILPVFLENGFTLHQEYVSVLTEIDHPMWKRAKRTKLTDEYRVEMLYGDEVYSRLNDIYEVASESFTEAYLYEPITQRDFIDIYVEGLKGIVPDLVIIYRFDSPVAFCFCYEDPQKRFYVCKTVAIKKKERNSGVFSKLLDCSYKMMEKRGHIHVLHHFKNLKSRTEFSYFRNTFIKQKKYALLEFENAE